MSRVRRTPASLSFATVLIVALVAATILFRAAQRRAMDAATHGTQQAVTDLSETQQAYLAARLGTSERLFSIAFAIVGGLLALHFSEKARSPLNNHAIFSACALLLASIYSAFLFQVGVSHCLEVSPNDMYSPVMSYPIVAQFWFLFIAVILIALALMRQLPRVGIVTVVFVAGLSTVPSPLIAAPVATGTSDYTACVTAWADARELRLPESAIYAGSELVAFIAVQEAIEVTAETRCTVAETLLDQVRFQTLETEETTSAEQTNAAVATMLRDALAATRTPNASLGDLLDDLVSIAEVWRVAAGVIEFLDESDDGQLFVTVVSRERPPKQRKGRTRWILRLPPGTYDVTAADGAEQVYTDVLVVKDGDRKTVPLRVRR